MTNKTSPNGRDPDDAPLTDEEKRAVAQQGRMIADEIALEDAMRTVGKPTPGPFDGAEWGD